MGNYAPDTFRNFQELSRLAEARSIAERKLLFTKIGHFLANDENRFSDTEMQIMCDVICRIVGDVEIKIRKEFAEKLAPLVHIPRKLVIFLANSDIEVAFPILKNSTILSDPDLLAVIAQKTSQHQLAIAVRSTVSEVISEALCEAGDENVAVVLLKNPGARIPNQLLELLADKSKTEVVLQAPLIQRPKLPLHEAQKMYPWVSSALKSYNTENFEIDRAVLDVKSETEQKTVKKLGNGSNSSYCLVEKLHTAGELTIGFMLKSLRQGDNDLFEFSFARLSGLDHDLVKHVMCDENKEFLAVACKMLKLDRIVFSTIYELLSSSDDPANMPGKAAKQEILHSYDSLSPSQAATIIRTSDFLKGNKQLSQLSRLH